MNNIFPNVPIIAYSRAKNLNDHLVRAKLQTTNHSNTETVKNKPRSESPTLLMLQDLEAESRGFNDYYTLSYEQYENNN